jgi:polyisoprenoid-binding protein YceI
VKAALTLLSALLSALLAGAVPPAAAAPWTIDPTHTFVNFELPLFGLSTQRGRFDRRQGSLEFDPAARRGRVEFVVETASVNSGAPALDEALRRLLDSAAHPQARFVADSLAFDGNRVRGADGELTLRGQTRPLALKALRFDCYFNPLFRRQVCGGDFEATLRRSDWGMDGGSEIGLADSLRLLVQIEAISP